MVSRVPLLSQALGSSARTDSALAVWDNGDTGSLCHPCRHGFSHRSTVFAQRIRNGRPATGAGQLHDCGPLADLFLRGLEERKFQGIWNATVTIRMCDLVAIFLSAGRGPKSEAIHMLLLSGQ